MASRTVLLDIKDLRGGRNGVDSPLELQPDQCVEAINVDWYQGLMGRKRRGAENVALTGVTFTTGIRSLLRHMTAVETDNELWAFDQAVAGRLVDGAWQQKTLVAAATGVVVVGASFNQKLFLAYPNTDGRLHVWDGTVIRKTGIGMAGTIPSVTPAAGTGITAYRRFRAAFITQTGGVVTKRGEMGPQPVGLNITNAGGWVVGRPALLNEGETHWELYEATTGNGPYDPGPYYLMTTLPVATTTYTETTPHASFPPVGAPLAPLVGAYTQQPSCKYLLVDEARLLMGSIWSGAITQYGSRVWWSPVLNDVSGVSNDERLAITVNSLSFIDFDPGDGGDLTGMGGPLYDSPYVFKFDRIYKMVRTGLAGAPYRPVTVSKKAGAIRHQTIVLGEDETGAECLYFLSRRGPYRIGVNGLQYCGRDIEDLWATVNLRAASHVTDGAHGVYLPDLHQVWWWVNTEAGIPSRPTLKLVFDVKQGRFTAIDGVRRGWSQHTGKSAYAYASVMFSEVPGLINSLTLKPYISQAEGLNLWRCDMGTSDLGFAYESLIRTRVELPGGSVAIHGGVIEGHLVSHPPGGAAIPLTVTTIRDFGLERRDAVAMVADTVPATIRVVTPLRDLGAASVAALQIEIRDQSVAQGWTLDELVLRVRREEDR